MKLTAQAVFYAVAVVCLLGAAAGAVAQDLPVGSGTNLSSVMFFDPPNEQLVKMRLTGAEMTPLPGAKYEVKELKIEWFGMDGQVRAVAETPQCVYARFGGTANSPGHLALSLDEGRIRTQGDGFLWRQDETSLTISNRVHTVIKMGNAKVPTL
jgi:hypothetical protein